MSFDVEWLLAGVDRVWAPVATPLGLFLALSVTAHVLLSKRDVASCIGWIGLAFLAPVWGALLYLMLGINRVVRRAQRLRRPRPPRDRGATPPLQLVPDHLRPLEHAVHRIANRMAEGHTSVEVFHDGDQAYPVMLAAIETAKRSVALSTYIIRDDAVGQRFVEALEAALRRGVQVRVLIDGVGSGYFFPPIVRRMRRAGLRLVRFMHSAMPWRMPFLNLRSHKKILVLDGTIGFTGGMNIAAGNVLREKPAWPISDIHFMFEGPVVAQLMDDFARDWSFETGERLDGPDWFPAIEERGGVVARVISSGPDRDFEKIQLVLLEAIACARTSIKLMTPYFLPGEAIVTSLALAALRGVRVDVIVPSRSDHRFIDSAMRAHVGPLLDHGVRIWRSPPPFNHSKLLVVDKQWSLIGSANWDTRSLRLNFEQNVEIYDASLAERLDAIMMPHQQARLRLRELNARSLPKRLRDAGSRLLLPYI